MDGRPQAVTGQAWFDHEWSSDYVDPQAQGWDWLGVNLHDGGALMAFRMHDAQGGKRWASAKLRSPRANPAEAGYGAEQVEWTPLATWRSPRTGVVYPIRWRVQVGDRRMLVEPLLDDAELDSRPSTGILYSEGPIRRLDEGSGDELGRGYLELTGYGGKLDL